jgi:hypothetical protein
MGKSTAPEPGVTVKDMTVPVDGGTIPVHIFTPEGKGPFPVMVYYHGGGFVIADTKVYEASPRALAKMANAIMVSVDYRRRRNTSSRPRRTTPTRPTSGPPSTRRNSTATRCGGGRRRIGRRQPGHRGVDDGARQEGADAGAPAAGLPGRRQRHEHARPTSATPTPSRSTSR